MDTINKCLNRFTSHQYFLLTNRGNTAIQIALKLMRQQNKTKIILPDQGIWLSLPQLVKKLKLAPATIKTNQAFFSQQQIPDGDFLFYQNPAGYFAEINEKEIYHYCQKKKIRVVADITGFIGTQHIHGHSDMYVCSFGDDKPLNLGYGGFISFRDKQDYQQAQQLILEHQRFDQQKIEELEQKLISLPMRINKIIKISQKVKQELENKFSIIHQEKEGLNVIIKPKDGQEKQKIINYAKKNNYEYVLCPCFIRILEPAVSLELKRLVKEEY